MLVVTHCVHDEVFSRYVLHNSDRTRTRIDVGSRLRELCQAESRSSKQVSDSS